MAIIVPNAASTYTSDTCIAIALNRWCWIGFQPNAGASGGSMSWFVGNAASAGSPLMPIVVASANRPVMFGPFMPTVCGLFAGSITTGSAILWVKASS